MQKLSLCSMSAKWNTMNPIPKEEEVEDQLHQADENAQFGRIFSSTQGEFCQPCCCIDLHCCLHILRSFFRLQQHWYAAGGDGGAHCAGNKCRELIHLLTTVQQQQQQRTKRREIEAEIEAVVPRLGPWRVWLTILCLDTILCICEFCEGGCWRLWSGSEYWIWQKNTDYWRRRMITEQCTPMQCRTG